MSVTPLKIDINCFNCECASLDEVLYSGEYYKQLFLSERDTNVCSSERKRLEEMGGKLDIIIANQQPDTAAKAPTCINSKDLGAPNWDEWLKFCYMVGEFESHQYQYILVTDSLPSEDLECFSILRGVSWRMVLDFDPMSEEKGFYREFTSKEGQSNLISMITPAELRKSSMGSLLRQIDPQKTQWLFVNGRYSDTEGSAQSFPDWEATSVKHISRLFGCCSDPDKFDKQKPIVCLILPFRQKSLPYLEVTLSRLNENFDEFKLQLVSFKHKLSHLISRKFQVRHFDLSPQLVGLGLSGMLSASATQEYRMPSSHAGVSAKLSQNEFLYLKEHLQILYDGCEDLPEFSNDPAEAENFFEEHRKSFISGNHISLVSLFDNHDARREIEGDIRSHVHRLLDQGLTRSVIVEIRHSPGTGGSTIARRVMWDLHKTYPCALLEISGSRHYFDEDNTLSDKFANRITALEEICHTSPVILIDGKQSGLIEGLSNKLVRMLCNKGKRALLLRCQHGSKTTKRVTQESHVHHVFDVNVKLEDSIADLNEFQSKYKGYIAQSLGENQRPNLCRVFHFPLLAMMEEFRPKLKKIIEDTLDEMGGIQQEMAMVVAFLQKYANHVTPAFLLYEAFKGYIRVSGDKRTTYEDIKQLFTEHLLNLMVPTDPLRHRGRSSALRETPPPESYTLQHPLVAEMVLKRVYQVQECDLFGVVTKFLQFPIYQHEFFLPLFEDLFLHNKYGLKVKFSILFEDLKRIDSEHAARVFCEAAVKTNDAAVFANAARFLAKKEPPSFSDAKDLIQRAFQANNAKVRLRSLYHTKGLVLFHEMKSEIHSGKVRDLQRLEDLASEVLKAYHEARNFPPTYPHPLIGEVEVWLACIDWIMKNRCSRDSDMTLKFLTNRSPPFFRTCVSDSFNLLDIVDGICQSVPNLSDPEETQRLSNNARLSLLKTFKQGLSVTGRRRDADDLIQACKALCSAPNFPRSSQVELKKLQAHFILSASDPIDILNHENLVYLLKLLEELVLVENEYRLAYHLMKVCVLVTGPRCYSLEQGLAVSEKWRDVSSNDCLPYFYQMTIYFLKILDGNSLEFAPKYTKALRMCQEKSQNHFRSTQSTLFVGKGGQGMSRLITRNTLFRGETDYATYDSDKVSKFWRVDSRKKLLECKGRIRVSEQSFFRGKIHPYIELVQGNLQLYVGKNADIGKVERDFNPGALVYFVVSFNLHGPVANGITFSPQEPSHG